MQDSYPRPPASRLGPLAVRAVLVAAIAAPALYFVLVTQHSAITYPFWDHVELVRLLVRYYDGSLRFADLFAPHNHTRPFGYRSIYLVNAILTRWDIRSEYIYMIAIGLGTWAVHLAAVRRIVGPSGALVALATAAVASVLVFSPVGHNNHWWSMMLQLTFANLLIVAAATTLSFDAGSWPRHVAAAALAWLAAYTLTNGIFVFIAAAGVMQLSGRNRRVPDRFAVFWLVNLVALLALYLPGLPSDPGRGRPSVTEIAVFALSYLGTPLASLVHFPFQSQFDIPKSTTWTATVGAVVLVAAAATLRRAWAGLGRREPRTIALFMLVGLGLVSALATAWGRAAFDELGVSNANASRYNLFSSYVVFGLLYYHAASPALRAALADPQSARFVRWTAAIGLAAFFAVSGVTYTVALRVYRDAHAFNQTLANAFNASGSPTPFDGSVYPNPEFVQLTRTQLLRWGLGPYRFRPQHTARLADHKMVDTFALTPGSRFVQPFRVTRGGMLALSLQVVTWGKQPSPYDVTWELRARDAAAPLARGVVQAQKLTDWASLELPVETPPTGERDLELVLSVPPGAPVAAPLGLPLFSAAPPPSGAALLPDKGAPSGPVLGFSVRFAGG